MAGFIKQEKGILIWVLLYCIARSYNGLYAKLTHLFMFAECILYHKYCAPVEDRTVSFISIPKTSKQVIFLCASNVFYIISISHCRTLQRSHYFSKVSFYVHRMLFITSSFQDRTKIVIPWLSMYLRASNVFYIKSIVSQYKIVQ